MKQKSIKVKDILPLVVADYKANGQNPEHVETHIKNQLLPFFGEKVAILVRKSHINDYKTKRRENGVAVATIHRELAVLRRAYNLAVEDNIIDHMPKISTPKKQEAGPRTDYFEHNEFLKFQTACRAVGARKNFDGELVADIYIFAYYSGWRLSEVLGLNKSQIKADRIAELPPEKHKNRELKIFPLDEIPEVRDMVQRRLNNVSPDGLLFHRKGKPVKSVRKLAQTICKDTGIGKKTFHALRRSCRTNMGNAGVDDQTGMKITGHKTLEVYNGYNQIQIRRMREALRQTYRNLNQSESAPDPVESSKKKSGNMTNTDSAGQVSNYANLQGNVAEREGFEPPLPFRVDLISSPVAHFNLPKPRGFFSRLWQRITNKRVTESSSYPLRCPNCGSWNMVRIDIEDVACCDCHNVTDWYEAYKKGDCVS